MPRIKYTPEDIKKVERLTNKGVSDVEIEDLTGFNRGFITSTTTDYWKQKMINKDEEKK